MTPGERGAAAAAACVGARFRVQGRDPATGLDCVGVAGIALRAGGWNGRVRADYAMRTGDWGGEPEGLIACDGGRPGDILLCRAMPTQLHLAVRIAGGIVHADMAARRVVARPGDVPWPVVRAYRIGE
ncbi:hypothetical protein ASG29_00370 [Sphingomonas sp. Leaf412]|uniref:hypothetical protein n=1 Tax=Sphingomonas sp. Leaf412 TaxID=1736370 RepID=UPI0006F92EBD|nr:hypothetical protein [Sphingomonas sp. Leaf412]KQT34664.1 hypothetical protein ASG29_00370 [Sphingomonas sp. Leaf412]